MSANGHRGHSRSGHGQSSTSTSSSNSLVIALRCPQWFAQGKHLEVKNPANAASPNSSNSSPSNLDGPKQRRGRPSKMPEQPAIAQPPKSKSIAMPKAVGIRFSKRKANQLDPASIEVDEDAVKPVTDSTAAHNNITAENSLKAAEDASDIISSKPKRQKTASPLSKSKINDSGLMTTSTAANGQITPPVNESENINNSHLSTSNIHFLQDSNMDDISGAVDPSASIEHDDDASQQPIEGVITRNAAKTKSASPNFEALQQTVDTDSIMQDDDESVANEVADEDESTPATPTGRGRGRWPNGAVKARNAAAAAALSKKNGIKKKGAPGKRKISDNALVQAIYDRQARLRTQYKEVRKALIKSELEHLDRSLEELEESEDRYKQCPAYEQVIAVLDKRLADEIATRERQEQIERDMLDRRREADAALAWREFECRAADVREKYEMKAMKAALDLLDKYNAEDDDDMSIEDNEHDPDELERLVDFQDNEFMDIDTPVEIEAAKPEKPAGRVKRGKKKIANQEPLSHQTPHRHAPAMLSAHTADEDQSESEKPVSQPLVVAALGRNKKQVHYDQHGVYIPKEGRKGPQREEPNNRAVIKPWFNFEQGEIGMKSYPSELKEPNRPHFPSGNLHVDQARGQYNLDNTADEFDQKLIATFKLHPTMGLPIPGSVNPDDAFPLTDYDAVLKHTPKPFVQPDAKRPEGVSVSKSYDFINTERRWNNLEVRLKMGQYGHLKEQYGQSGLATYDPQAKDVSAAQYAVEDMLEAAEELERQEREPSKLAKSASPSPIRKSARVKEKALKAQMSKSPAPLPVTPPPRPPPILSTAQLSCLADAAEIRRHEDYRHSMEPSTIYERTILPQPQPPQNAPPRPHSQMPHLAFITNPAPAPGLNEIRPIAPQPQRPLPLHPAPQQQLLPGPPPPQQPQRSYGPVMMGPPPPGTYMPYPMQSHPPGIFYGSPAHSHASPPPPQPAPHPSQAKRPLRPGPNLRSLLPRSMHGDPVGPPQGPLHGHPQTQSPIYYGGGPPPNYQQQYERHYEGPGGAAPGPLGAPHAGPGGHHSPYRSEPYGPGPQAHYQGPGGPSQPPNGYFPFQHHDMRRR